MAVLEITSEDNEITYENYTGSGPLSFDFAHAEKADVNVDVDGVTLPLSAWVHTPVEADGGYDGGTVTLVTPVAGADVRIWRDMVRLRATQFGVGGASPMQVNTELNRLVLMAQDIRRQYDSVTEGLGALTEDVVADLATVAEALADGTLEPTDEKVAAIGNLSAVAGEQIEFTSATGVRSNKRHVATYAELADIPADKRFDGLVVHARGRASDGDGGHQPFYFDADATDTGNGATIITPTAGTGRWKSLKIDGLFDTQAFGTIGDNATECATNFNATLSAIPTTGSVPGGVVQIQRGRFLLATALTVPDYSTLRGFGATTTRLNFNSLASGSAILASGQDYHNNFTDFLVENAPDYALEILDGSNSLFQNLAILGKTTGTTSGGIRAGTNSYMNAFVNIRATDVRAHGWYNEGFTTSQLLMNYFVLGSDKTAFRWNHVVYSAAICTGSDDSLEYGHEFTNANAVGLFMPGIERSTKAAFKFQAGASLDPVTVTNVKDIKDVVVVGGFGNDCGGSGEPTAIEAIATDSRTIRALFLGYHDDNLAGGSSVEIDGTNVHILAIGGQFPGGVTASNSATFGHMKYDELGLTFEINGTRRMRIDEGTTSFNNTLNNAYGFVFSGTTDSIGEIGLWLIPGDTNASARSWGIGLGRHERGDFAITQGTSQGANPVSGNTRLHIRADGKVGIGTSSAAEALQVTGFVRASSGFKHGSTQVVGAQGAAISDVATGGSATAAANATAINSILDRLRAHGLIAT